jgi:hypothetical protein
MVLDSMYSKEEQMWLLYPFEKVGWSKVVIAKVNLEEANESMRIGEIPMCTSTWHFSLCFFLLLHNF